MSNSNESSTYDRIDTKPTEPFGSPNTLLNGLIGGIVSVLLSFLPFSPIIGGAVAGYLQRGGYSAGAKVGVVAGIVGLIPVALVGLSVLYLPIATPEPLVHGVVAVPLLVLVVIYVIGFTILGGVLGSILNAKLAN